jgi:hypothetical protein
MYVTIISSGGRPSNELWEAWMLRSTFGVTRLVLGLVTVLTLALVGSSSAAAAAPSTTATSTSTATWQLLDVNQRVCIPAGVSWWTYFGIIIDGEWSTPLETGARDLPAGTITDLPSLMPPGSGDGHVVQELIAITLPPLAMGVYQAELTASDGVETQSTPITIKVQENWGCV